MTVNDFRDKFWRYYLVLEERFEDISRYVELSVENNSTYSIEFANQLQAIGSEIDVIMKSMSGFGASEQRNIADYASKILVEYPNIKTWSVKTRDIVIYPFKDWDAMRAGKSLAWWRAYNKVKHGRSSHYKKANLKNTLHALMALYLLEMLYFKKLADDEGKPDVMINGSKLFSIVGWQSTYESMNNVIFKVENNTLYTETVQR